MISVSHIAIRLAGCPEALRMSRPHAPHPVPSLSLECVEPLGCACRAFPHWSPSLSAECTDWLRACLSSTREVFPSNDIAKVLKI